MLQQQLTGASVTSCQMRLDFVRCEALVMLADEGGCHQAITVARMFMQRTVERPFGFQASEERRKLIHQGEMVGWVGFCGTIARTDLADVDTFHAEVQRPRDYCMARFVEAIASR
jgi:hypothetical protein